MKSPIPIYAVVTESHRALLEDWFLKYLPDDCIPTIAILKAAPVSFRSGHWHKIFIHKLQLVLQAIERHSGEIISISDVDIQFFRTFADEVCTLIEGYDILFQNSKPEGPEILTQLCAGFSIVRCGPVAAEFFKEALRLVEEKNDPSFDDQVAFQSMCSGPTKAKVGLLPNTYWTCGKMWFPDMPLDLPENIALHHAAWIVGNGGKVIQLEKARAIVEARNHRL